MHFLKGIRKQHTVVTQPTFSRRGLARSHFVSTGRYEFLNHPGVPGVLLSGRLSLAFHPPRVASERMCLLETIYSSRPLDEDLRPEVWGWPRQLSNLKLWFARLGCLWQYDSLNLETVAGQLVFCNSMSWQPTLEPSQVLLWNLDTVLTMSVC